MSGPMVPDPNIYNRLNGGRRNRIQGQLKSGLQQFPAVEFAQYVVTRTGIDKEIRADFDCDIFLEGKLNVDEAFLTVNWWTHPDGPDEFKFHYHDESEYDCGWHRHENKHVDGLDHLQWRTSPDDDYQYEAMEFDYDQPPGVLWEVRDRLKEHLLNKI